MNDRRSLIVLILATLPIAVPVAALFFIHDLGSLIRYVFGGWALVAILTFVVVKLISMAIADDRAADAPQSNATSVDR